MPIHSRSGTHTLFPLAHFTAIAHFFIGLHSGLFHEVSAPKFYTLVSIAA